MKDVYAQVTDEFNGEYGYEIGTYAFVPINGFDNGDGVKSENDREVIDILPDVCRKECMRVFKEVCDKWSKYDAQGETFDKDSTWRTLSADEWSYLVDNHNKKWTTVCGTKGLAIAPDGVPASALADSYQSNAWKDAENAGIIFLPDTGVRHSTGTSEIGMCGYFWSSTLFTWDECAFYLSLSNNKDAATQYHKRKFGCGVRLVTEAK